MLRQHKQRLYERRCQLDMVLDAVHQRGVDIILNAAGEPTRSQSLQLLAPFGRLVIFGNASNQPDLPLLPSDLLTTNRAVLGYSFSSLTKRAPHVTATAALQVFNFLARGLVRVEMLHVLPLEQAAEAHRLIGTSKYHREGAPPDLACKYNH